MSAVTLSREAVLKLIERYHHLLKYTEGRLTDCDTNDHDAVIADIDEELCRWDLNFDEFARQIREQQKGSDDGKTNTSTAACTNVRARSGNDAQEQNS